MKEKNSGEVKKINTSVTVHIKKEMDIIKKIHEHKKDIQHLKDKINHQFYGIEDMFYRFYHRSFKVYDLQNITQEIIDLFCSIGECNLRDLNSDYIEIVSEGIYKKFDHSHNIRWNYETRPIVEAFFHSQHLLEMMEKYGLAMDPNQEAPNSLTQGWASILYLYKIR